MAHCKIHADDTLMVGDSINDIKAAAEAHVKSIAVNFGYDGGLDLLKYGASRRIDSLDQLQLFTDNITGKISIREYFETTFRKSMP